MSDPLLAAHRVLPRFFVISGWAYPISIRDQMVRGRWLADRAYQNGLIDSQSPLLVFGAGVSGVTAAIRAAQLGVPVKLVHKSARPFSLQAGVSTRWLDPTQFDWPLDHWSRQQFPWPNPVGHRVGPVMPLPYAANWSNRLAAQWTAALRLAQRHWRGSFDFFPLHDVHNIRIRSSNQFDVDLKEVNPPHATVTCPGIGAIFWAAGFGQENCEVEDLSPAPPSPVCYRGIGFWDNDHFTQTNCGVPSSPAEVVIAGSGDGALQDFLRIVTGLDSAEAILTNLPITLDIERRIHCAEDQALRAWTWSDPKHRHHDHAIHVTLDQAHQAAAVEALKIPRLKGILAKLLRNIDVRLVFQCTHLTSFYGLNRFLVWLIDTYLKQSHSRNQFLIPQTTIRRVQGKSGHHCVTTNPHGCHGQPHAVELCAAPNCWNRVAKPVVTPTQTIDANVIVVRFGIQQGTTPAPPHLPGLILPLDRPRQALPFFVPQP